MLIRSQNGLSIINMDKLESLSCRKSKSMSFGKVSDCYDICVNNDMSLGSYCSKELVSQVLEEILEIYQLPTVVENSEQDMRTYKNYVYQLPDECELNPLAIKLNC